MDLNREQHSKTFVYAGRRSEELSRTPGILVVKYCREGSSMLRGRAWVSPLLFSGASFGVFARLHVSMHFWSTFLVVVSRVHACCSWRCS